MSLTVTQGITEIMLLWGIEQPDVSAPATRARAMIDLNRSVQMLWANSEKLDYFNQSTVSATLTATSESISLDGSIQNVIGPVRITATGVVINPLKTRFEAQNYARIYLGQDSIAEGIPLAYYLERTFQSDADSMALSLFPVPIPLVDTPISLDVIMDAPSYSYTDYCDNTVIPVPHAYAESILVPLLRHAAMSHFLFVAKDLATQIEEQYIEARKALGLNAPEVDEIQPEATPVVMAPWNQRRDR